MLIGGEKACEAMDRGTGVSDVRYVSAHGAAYSAPVGSYREVAYAYVTLVSLTSCCLSTTV